MPFPQSVKDSVWRRSGGKCECRRKGHSHSGRCSKPLTRSTVEYHHVHAESLGGHNGLSNCEALCRACHHGTASYGRH